MGGGSQGPGLESSRLPRRATPCSGLTLTARAACSALRPCGGGQATTARPRHRQAAYRSSRQTPSPPTDSSEPQLFILCHRDCHSWPASTWYVLRKRAPRSLLTTNYLLPTMRQHLPPISSYCLCAYTCPQTSASHGDSRVLVGSEAEMLHVPCAAVL